MNKSDLNLEGEKKRKKKSTQEKKNGKIFL